MTGPHPAAAGLLVAGPADAEGLAALHAGSFAAGARWPADEIAALLRLDTVTGLIAGMAARPSGFLLLSQVADEAEILTLAVDPARRRTGLALRLLDAAVALATARGAGRLLLEVAEGNAPARALYGKAGFREAGRRPGYYATAAGSEDALLLELRLTVVQD